MEIAITPVSLNIAPQLPDQSVIGPEGYKLLITFLVVAAILLGFLIGKRIKKNKNYTRFRPVRKKTRIETTLEKNRVYFPDYLTLSIRNTGSSDVDIDRPLVVFESFLVKRNFRLKGIDGYHFYPLYLEAGKAHHLRIDLSRFYLYDKHLKRFSKITVVISSMQGKILSKKSLMVRKTLFR